MMKGECLAVNYQNINNGSWDYLIILDACRYDCFEEVYSKYLQGNLEKRISRGTHTLEWLSQTFRDRYPYTYISANPYINSEGVDSREVSRSSDISWNASNHFKRIVDVWKQGWNEEENTVLPDEVNKRLKNCSEESKVIAHYMQPHTPFITAPITEEGFHSRDVILEKDEPGNADNPWRNLYERDRDLFIEYYKENLEIVLKSFSELIESISGEIIITSDHGESFGEEGVFGHPPGTHISSLTEVPWLKIHK